MMKDGISRGSHRVGQWNRSLRRNGLAQLADTRSLFQKGHRTSGQTTVVHEFIADCAARPPAPKERHIPIQPFFAHLACARFDTQEHRLPIATGFSNTHSQ